MNSGQIDYTKKEMPEKVVKLGYGLLAIGFVLVVAAFAFDYTRASFNSLISFMFVFSLGVGSLFLVALEHIAGAYWSVPFRRISELLTALIFVAPVLAIPVLFDLHGLFHWSHVEAVEADTILAGKSSYLNESFFYIRFVVIFVIFILFRIAMVGGSFKQDTTGSVKINKINARLSAAFMPFFAFMLSIMAIDWLMSLEPHWFSTIFGVYYFAGTFLVALSLLTLYVLYLNKEGMLIDGISSDHLYNFGALLFAFVNFWAYIAFSQYMLIWYANMPEETYWFIIRSEHGWEFISLALIVIHFVVPYVMILSQPSKSSKKRLKVVSYWILGAHYYNLYWLVMPTFSKDGPVLGWYELVFPIFTAGLIITTFNFVSKKRNLVAIGDPKLKRGIDFRL